MKISHLLVLVMVLSALVFVAWQRGREERSAREPLGGIEMTVAIPSLVPLFPSFDRARVAEIVLTRGDSGEGESEGLRLIRREGRWLLASAWDAPADAVRVDRLLEILANLRGDLRSEVATSHEKYRLDADSAFRILLRFDQDGEAGAVRELYLGKAVEGDLDLRYARGSGGGSPYAIPGALAEALGLDYEDAMPARTVWLDRRMTELDRDGIRQLTLTGPDHRVVLERRPEVAEEADEEAETADKGNDSGEERISEAAKADKNEVWVATDGGWESALPRMAAVDRVLTALSGMRAMDVVDPAPEAGGKGLDRPDYELVVQPDAGGPLRLSAVRDGEERVRVRLSTHPRMVFIISPKVFSDLFPEGRELFELTSPRPERAAVSFVEYRRGRHGFSFVRGEGGWKVMAAGPGFALRPEAAGRLLDAAESWTPAGYANRGGRDGFGVVEPSARVTFVGGAEAMTLASGAERSDGRGYVDAGKGDVLLANSKDRARLFPTWAEVFDLGLFTGMKSEDCREIRMALEGGTAWILARDLENWTLAPEEGEPRPIDANTATEWVEKVLALSGTDLDDGEANASTTKNVARLTVVGASGTVELALGPERDGYFPVKASDRVAIWVPAAAVSAVLETARGWAVAETP